MNKFKVGDKVKLNSYKDWEYPKYKDQEALYISPIVGFLSFHHKIMWSDNITSLVSDSNLIKAKKTIEDIEVGDAIINTGGTMRKFIILEILENIVCAIPYYLKDNVAIYNDFIWIRKSVLETHWSLVNENKTITIEGKIYNKEEVEKRLSELKPIA